MLGTMVDYVVARYVNTKRLRNESDPSARQWLPGCYGELMSGGRHTTTIMGLRGRNRDYTVIFRELPNDDYTGEQCF